MLRVTDASPAFGELFFCFFRLLPCRFLRVFEMTPRRNVSISSLWLMYPCDVDLFVRHKMFFVVFLLETRCDRVFVLTAVVFVRCQWRGQLVRVCLCRECVARRKITPKLFFISFFAFSVFSGLILTQRKARRRSPTRRVSRSTAAATVQSAFVENSRFIIKKASCIVVAMCRCARVCVVCVRLVCVVFCVNFVCRLANFSSFFKTITQHQRFMWAKTQAHPRMPLLVCVCVSV